MVFVLFLCFFLLIEKMSFLFALVQSGYSYCKTCEKNYLSNEKIGWFIFHGLSVIKTNQKQQKKNKNQIKRNSHSKDNNKKNQYISGKQIQFNLALVANIDRGVNMFFKKIPIWSFNKFFQSNWKRSKKNRNSFC